MRWFIKESVITAQLLHYAMSLKWCKCYQCGNDGIITNNKKYKSFIVYLSIQQWPRLLVPKLT